MMEFEIPYCGSLDMVIGQGAWVWFSELSQRRRGSHNKSSHLQLSLWSSNCSNTCSVLQRDSPVLMTIPTLLQSAAAQRAVPKKIWFHFRSSPLQSISSCLTKYCVSLCLYIFILPGCQTACVTEDCAGLGWGPCPRAPGWILHCETCGTLRWML